MPAWKVLLVMVLGFICLGLALGTIIVPLSMAGDDKWGWFGGLLAGTVVMSTLLILFLRNADRTFK